jgi:Glycosyltransferase family 87
MRNRPDGGPLVLSPSGEGDQAAAGAVSQSRPSRLRIAAVLTPLLVFCLLWLFLWIRGGALQGGPSGSGYGADFAMFIGAARVMQVGANPYDHVTLYRTERLLLHRQRLRIIADHSIVRVGNPPLFFWALQPLLRFPFQSVAVAWIVATYVLTGLGCAAACVFLGWRRVLVQCLLFLLIPQVVLGAYWGNVVGLVFVGIALALARSYPFAAGMLVSVAWLKPQVALPAVLLMLLFHTGSRRRFAAGFLTACVLWLVATILTVGLGELGLWVRGLTTYSHDIAVQKEMPSLSGLYARWAGPHLRLALETTVIGVAAVLTAWTWWRWRRSSLVPMQAVAWLWFLWFLAAPYAHFQDEIILTAPLLSLLGRDGVSVARPLPGLVLYLTVLSPLFIVWSPLRMDLICIPLLAATLVMAYLSSEDGTPEAQVRSSSGRPGALQGALQ